MRKKVLLMSVIVLGMTGPLLAQAAAPTGELHGAIGVTFDTKYI